MDRLIWDLDSLHTMLAALRKAAQQLQECQTRLYTASAAAQEMVGNGSAAAPLRRLAEDIRLLAQRTRKAVEYSTALAAALTQIRDRMTDTEAELVGMVSELPTSADVPIWAIQTWTEAGSAPLYTVPPTRWTYGIVPEWLAQAADRMPPQ